MNETEQNETEQPPKTIGPASDADMLWQLRASLAEALGLVDDPEKPWTNLVEAVWSLQPPEGGGPCSCGHSRHDHLHDDDEAVPFLGSCFACRFRCKQYDGSTPPTSAKPR